MDEGLQSTALSLMALEGGHNASQLLISEPTPHTIQVLRLLQKVLGASAISFLIVFEWKKSSDMKLSTYFVYLKTSYKFIFARCLVLLIQSTVEEGFPIVAICRCNSQFSFQVAFD